MTDDRLDEFGVYSLYLACKLHYANGTYNAVKYRFKTSAKPASFWKRKDRYFFYKVGTKLGFNKNLILDFFNAHFIEDISWVGTMLENETIWTDYQKRLQSFKYRFETDINTLCDDHCERCSEVDVEHARVDEVLPEFGWCPDQFKRSELECLVTQW